MLDLSVVRDVIPPMTEMAIDNVRQLEDFILKCPQTDIPTSHLFHAGVYARTIKIPAGVVLTGALIKIATALIVSGNCIVYMGDQAIEIKVHKVLAASAHRKQAFVAKTDTYLTMVFATEVKTVGEAEDEFTDEADRLLSRGECAVNTIIATGDT